MVAVVREDLGLCVLRRHGFRMARFWRRHRSLPEPQRHGVEIGSFARPGVGLWRLVEEKGEHEEAEGEALETEDERQQIGRHHPVVVDETGAATVLARFLPRLARLVDERAKENWRRNGAYDRVKNQLDCSSIRLSYICF